MPASVTNLRTITRPWEYFVRKADPDYNKERYAHIEYEFSNGRQYKVRDYRTRFPYDQ